MFSIPAILVVDDNKDWADSLAMLLEIGGHQVTAAYSAPDALKRHPSLARGHPHGHRIAGDRRLRSRAADARNARAPRRAPNRLDRPRQGRGSRRTPRRLRPSPGQARRSRRARAAGCGLDPTRRGLWVVAPGGRGPPRPGGGGGPRGPGAARRRGLRRRGALGVVSGRRPCRRRGGGAWGGRPPAPGPRSGGPCVVARVRRVPAGGLGWFAFLVAGLPGVGGCCGPGLAGGGRFWGRRGWRPPIRGSCAAPSWAGVVGRGPGGVVRPGPWPGGPPYGSWPYTILPSHMVKRTAALFISSAGTVSTSRSIKARSASLPGAMVPMSFS